ncbi:hypothetical protein PGT21_008797 [Puccinia graminis f. sp. tritici]|uniref:Uncharacterized protein n=1 Tax=Puccinia graminis f. sp. tritici TaxID=56615 RepID=A0A5B0P7H8_PUCGR|nr:hypothetical protein PGT21_008797 [Puccinia graminis f. sp. tritici]
MPGLYDLDNPLINTTFRTSDADIAVGFTDCPFQYQSLTLCCESYPAGLGRRKLAGNQLSLISSVAGTSSSTQDRDLVISSRAKLFPQHWSQYPEDHVGQVHQNGFCWEISSNLLEIHVLRVFCGQICIQ